MAGASGFHRNILHFPLKHVPCSSVGFYLLSPFPPLFILIGLNFYAETLIVLSAICSIVGVIFDYSAQQGDIEKLHSNTSVWKSKVDRSRLGLRYLASESPISLALV